MGNSCSLPRRTGHARYVDYDVDELNQYIRWDKAGSPPTSMPMRQTFEYDEDGNVTDTWAAADANCDGFATFSDVNYFVAGLSGEESWKQYYRDHNGGAEPPCPFSNLDANGDGAVSFSDITPFSNLVGHNSAAAKVYTWNAENRLIGVEPQGVFKGARKAEYGYDYHRSADQQEGLDVRTPAPRSGT